MQASFDLKKALIVFGVIVILVAALSFLGHFLPQKIPPKTAEQPKNTTLASGGNPNPASRIKTFSDFINSLSEKQRECVKTAYGPIYEKLLNNDGSYLIPLKEEWRVSEANKCIK